MKSRRKDSHACLNGSKAIALCSPPHLSTPVVLFIDLTLISFPDESEQLWLVNEKMRARCSKARLGRRFMVEKRERTVWGIWKGPDWKRTVEWIEPWVRQWERGTEERGAERALGNQENQERRRIKRTRSQMLDSRRLRGAGEGKWGSEAWGVLGREQSVPARMNLRDAGETWQSAFIFKS